MAAETEYDASLTDRLRAELDGMGDSSPEEDSRIGRLIGRLEGEFRTLISEPARRERTLDFLRGPGRPGPPPATVPSKAAVGPLRRALNEMVTMSSRLDQATDPSEGFSLAESVAQQGHEMAYVVEGFLSALDPMDTTAGRFHRLVTFLSQLIRNAVAKMRAFAHLLHVTSFSVTFATTPPGIAVTFNFDTA